LRAKTVPDQPILHQEISDLRSDEGVDRFFDPAATRNKAMDFLARREYGQLELIRKLADKGYDRAIAQQAIENLTAEGLQSDLRFTDSFVQSRINQGKGPVRVRVDLGQRGIGDAAIKRALENASTDWYELARNTRIRKFGLGQPATFKAKAKQMRFLQYRGFESDQIQAAFSED